MAKKRGLVVSAAGGIAPGAPFVVGQGLIVQQAAPPFAASARFGQLPDAGRSFIAPDDSGAVESFVLGGGSRVPLASTRSVAIGFNVLAPGGAGSTKVVMIGSSLNAGAANTTAPNVIAIGHDITLQGTKDISGSVSIGNTIIQSGSANIGSVVIGVGSRVDESNNVSIGSNCDAANQSVAIGRSAGNLTGSLAVSVGDQSNAASNAVAVGALADASGASGVAIGGGALAGVRCVAIGRDAVGNAQTFSIVIGSNAEVFETNSCNIGGDPTNGSEMRVFRWGPNTLAGYPGLSIFLPSASAGNNVAAPNTTFRGGISTGNSVTGGRITFQSSTQGAAGAAYQAIADRLRIAPGGVAGLPTIEFVNQISTPGVAAGTLLNAPAAGNPTIWAEVLYNGVLKFIPMW